jgi:hypothetical protein
MLYTPYDKQNNFVSTPGLDARIFGVSSFGRGPRAVAGSSATTKSRLHYSRAKGMVASAGD